jgi:hypothetical protein
MSEFSKFPGLMPGWALDFVRAVAHRPWWARLLLWFVLGEPGRHEFWGLVWSIQDMGWAAYDFECEWRSDSIEPMPLFWLHKKVRLKK